MNLIDDFELWFGYNGKVFDYKNTKNGAWVKVDTTRGEVCAWALDEEDEERPVTIKFETLQKLVKDANSRVHWY